MSEQRASVWLIRHGETEWSVASRHTGRTDLPLTKTGQRQAAALRHHLKGRNYARVLVSPLSRALETCRIAGLGESAEVTSDLIEWDYGVYEGRTTPDVRKELPGWRVWTHEIPGGETVEQVGARTDRVIESLTHVEGDVALFAHSHLLRILGARWLGLPPDHGRFFTLGTASISVLGWDRENPAIICWNQSWHLGVDVSP